MATSPHYTEPIVTGDTSVGVVYRLTDSDGNVWRSAPQLLVNALKLDETPSVNAGGQWVIVPTLRHLLEGTTAQIEIYIQRTDLSLFRVIANDPAVDYLEVSPNGFYVAGGIMPTIAESLAQAPIGETLYTTGGGLPNDPPPQAECVAVWRNRAFLAFGNQIWPSQEFAMGLGLQFASNLRLVWNEGTGDIKAICQIDWNYLAIFKEDAVAIVSGPGPDGLGHGNYVLQTLTTKAGCTNAASVINGADGCYYQDAQTDRLMLLGSDLQIKEAAPGAFDTFATGTQITDALHVEAKRQVWFSTATGIIVLDYKHRTQSSPLGEVYTWPYAGIVGATIASGSPVLMLSSGATAAQVAAQYYDLATDGTAKTAVNRSIESADISPLGLQRMFNLSRMAILAEYQSAHTLSVQVRPNYATSATPHTKDVTAAAAQVLLRPEACMRIQAFNVRIDETTYTPLGGDPVYGPGSKFVGLALELQDHGKLQLMPVGRLM